MLVFYFYLNYITQVVKKKPKMKIPDISVVSSSDIVGSESCREDDFNEISDGNITPSLYYLNYKNCFPFFF